MHAKAIHKIVVGSNAFFKNHPNFSSGHDIDIIYIIDQPLFGYGFKIIHKQTDDKIFVYNSGKDRLLRSIAHEFEACSFLVPEFAKYIDLTIEDLKRLEYWFDKLDDKHKYEKLIYQYYLINNDFVLTEEQLNEAYKIYKKFR